MGGPVSAEDFLAAMDMATPSPSSLAEFVDRHSPVDKELPFVHSTRCEFFRHLCSAGFLSPADCPVFSESLLYFFYGRPAYRSKAGSLPNTGILLMPICFVFKPGVLDSHLRRVFPFDTGAAYGGMFSPHISPTRLTEFCLTPTLLSIKKAVSTFFETNEAYFAATPKDNLRTNATSGLASLDCYCSLITQDGETPYDDRRAVIEVQTAAPVSLKDTLLAVILPTPFLDDAVVRNAIVNEWRSYPLRYNHYRGTAPAEYVRVIADRLEAYLDQGGYF